MMSMENPFRVENPFGGENTLYTFPLNRESQNVIDQSIAVCVGR